MNHINLHLATPAEAAAVLDKRMPGWAHGIDLGKFDFRNSYACVLGQLFGSYGEGVDALGVLGVDVRYYTNPFNDDTHQMKHKYGRDWIRLIRKRQKQAT